MTAPYEREVLMLERLTEATESDKLKWRPEGKTHFIATAGSSVFDLASVDADDMHPFSLLVRRGDELVGEIESVNVEQEPAGRMLNHNLQVLYHAARRSAAGIGNALDDILRDLDSLDRPGGGAPF